MVLTSHRQSTWQFGFYAQDDFKITQRLTINYGLRFDILTPLTEANDYYSMVDTTKPNPAAGNLPGVYVFAGQNGVGSRIAPADKNSNNLGPRLGLAYALNDKTVLRSAYGISYFQTGAYGGGNNVNQNDAYWPTSTTASPDDLTGAYTFSQGFPARDLVIPPLITPALGVGTGFVNYWHPTAGAGGTVAELECGDAESAWQEHEHRRGVCGIERGSSAGESGYQSARSEVLESWIAIDQEHPRSTGCGCRLHAALCGIQRIVGAGPPAVPAVSEHVPRRKEFGYPRHVDL